MQPFIYCVYSLQSQWGAWMFENICSCLNIGVFTFSNLSGCSFVPQQVLRSSLDDLWDLDSKISKMGQEQLVIFLFV